MWISGLWFISVMIEFKMVNSDNLCTYFVYTQAHTHIVCLCEDTNSDRDRGRRSHMWNGASGNNRDSKVEGLMKSEIIPWEIQKHRASWC